jgi:hypothetical protein
MRKNKIHVNSGTYCSAPAQLERRMMSQIDLTAAFSDWGDECFFPERRVIDSL